MKAAIILAALGFIAIVLILRRKPRVSSPTLQPPAITPGVPVTVTSRYAETDGIAFDVAKIPEDLRDLLPYAKEWAIGDDLEREEYAKSVSMEQKKAFVDAVVPKMRALDAFHEEHKDAIPVPDEVVLFDMMTEAASELYCEVYPSNL